MTIPTNEAGEFEMVDTAGFVVATGTVSPDLTVELTYGEDQPDGPYKVVKPEPEFEALWADLPQSQHMTLRATAA